MIQRVQTLYLAIMIILLSIVTFGSTLFSFVNEISRFEYSSYGIVEYAKWFDGVGFGQMVIVDHGNSYRTLYAHASELLASKGQRVKAGQAIARVGDTGSLRGSMLYFELWKGTKAMPTRLWLR